VKAELGRPNAALLDAPGLQPTPVLAQAVFDYQKDVKQQRENAARTAEAMASSSAGKPSETKAAAGGEIQGESRTDMMSN
ncbi:hypothetical protein QIG09_26195, partial [Klebsiella pneumoniae]|nr:hypothetical protein [Klebsiella pneumoniae]